MRIFVAGATGALGRQLLPKLAERGHEVTGMTRTPSKASLVEELGARAAIADALDAEEVASAVANAEPEVIVHELTAISDLGSMRNVDRAFASTNRLRTEGTDHLLAAGRAIGVQRFVAQSFAAWLYERVGGSVKTEEDPLDPNPIRPIRETFGGDQVRGGCRDGRRLDRRESPFVMAGSTAPGRASGPAASISSRSGSGSSPSSATARASGPSSTSRTPRTPRWRRSSAASAASTTSSDDNPEPVRDWLPGMAGMIGAPAPRRVPKWLGRLAAGKPGVIMMTELRGASNAKAKRVLHWAPRHPSWRDGFAEMGAATEKATANESGRIAA